MLKLEYGHKCRSVPVEAAIYSLEAKGEELVKFRAFAMADLTVDLEDEKKQEQSSLELPVNFSKEDVVKVSIKALLPQ